MYDKLEKITAVSIAKLDKSVEGHMDTAKLFSRYLNDINENIHGGNRDSFYKDKKLRTYFQSLFNNVTDERYIYLAAATTFFDGLHQFLSKDDAAVKRIRTIMNDETDFFESVKREIKELEKAYY